MPTLPVSGKAPWAVLVEHQSTINGNLPLRDLLYIATVLKRMIDSKQLYREKTLRIPKPAFIVLYNGSEDIPAYQELRLSDAYLGEKNDTEEEALQLIVKVYNVLITAIGERQRRQS